MYNEIQISMRTWRSWMSAASQGAFVDIPKISHSDSSMYHKKQTPAFLCKSLLIADRVFGQAVCFQHARLVCTPTDENRAPIDVAVKSVPLPVDLAAFVSEL